MESSWIFTLSVFDLEREWVARPPGMPRRSSAHHPPDDLAGPANRAL